MKTAYPNTISPVTITLYRNIPFNNAYKDHSFIYNFYKRWKEGTKYYTSPIFTTTPSQENFLNRMKVISTPSPHSVYVYPRTTKTDVFNFDFSNGLIATITLELTAEETNSNYMKVVSGTGLTAQSWYYFITGIKQINADTYTLNLELDVIMTYGDEFMNGMQDIPVMTKRKHCKRFTDNGLMPYCADFKNGDSAFAGIKPNIISDFKQLTFSDTNMKNLEGVMWLYVCVDVASSANKEGLFTLKDKTYPFAMLCIPINVNSLVYRISSGGAVADYKVFDRDNITQAIKDLISNGSVHGAKISPYPPFASLDSGENIVVDSSGNLKITPTWHQSIAGDDFRFFDIGDNTFGMCDVASLPPLMPFKLLFNGFILISNQQDVKYDYDFITGNFGVGHETAYDITDTRHEDPKLLFSPFKKYTLSAQYSSEGCQFYPEILFSKYATSKSSAYFGFYTIATSYIGDNNFYTGIQSLVTTPFTSNYRYEKIGLACSVNYVFPCGENALDVFNSTQAQSFYQSKVASGITSGLSMAGGIASIVMGAGMTAGSSGTLSPIGTAMVATGAMAIASGTAGIADTIASSVAKVEDLKNTPDSINISGSNFITDDAIAPSNCLPYITVMECSPSIKKSADDYFYKYGYEVARQCYFNKYLNYNVGDTNDYVDTNMFTRTIFNYIQTDEDISMKINSDIPLIVKQKLSNIFMNGITLWTFLGLQNIAEESTAGYDVDDWLFKNTLENAEYKGVSY